MSLEDIKEFHKEMGFKLRRLRQNEGWSQEYVGQRIHATRQTIQRYEEGMTKIPSEKIQTLAKMFNVPIGHFFGEEQQSGVSGIRKSTLNIAHEIDRLESRELKEIIYRLTNAVNEELSRAEEEQSKEKAA